MRRRTRRSVVHLIFFVGILCLILFLNRPSPPSRSFAWTTVSYETTATRLPEARGECPGLAETDKPVLIVSRVAADDSSWLAPLAERYHLCVYTADAPRDPRSKQLQVPANRGHEAMGYLTFLIDNYSHLPAAGMVFVHGSRWAWHNDAPDYDNAALLAALNITTALAPWGYHNLRCDWSVSTCSPKTPAQGSLELSMQSVLEPWSARTASDVALPGALASLFGGDLESSRVLLGRNDAVRAQCCAQFVISRESVRQHTRDEYVALRQWLLDGRDESLSPNRRAAPRDDRVAGRILSYVWHILFIQRRNLYPEGLGGSIDLERLNSIACPRAEDCYCRLYGRCDLSPCSDGTCYGQYQLPRDFKVPEWVTQGKA
ncbi:hypothetical protein BO70DRAFT_362498 [Aspergillus heteromorphus CBS 117.55]|uniref:Uncharacterized protein n=1 Tax=Aspergillus heteromorphus CBS 117.55 TaxID=1448321 RepID=A0A317W3G1_9EURO|nr:uncharacterized protein BO70DRAFT_362498 [Aspergillus heteromorphus CBS 117.55]PWY80545.1 hypothetical protein BO70DRAFT_362498 [Aspergillus heteromorphus CBS 117.55]